MSYSMHTLFANSGNTGGIRSASQIEYLVFHYTGNQGDSAKGNATYFHNNVVKTSAHYFVDEVEVWQSVPDTTVAWAVGGKKYSNSLGGSMYGVVKNSNSISIELCGTAPNRGASEITKQNAAELGKYLMEKYNIPIQNVYRHYDVTGKFCPSWAVDAKEWTLFKKRLEEDDMDISKLTDDQVLSLANRMQKLLGAQPISTGMNAELQDAIKMGITDGTWPAAYCTRAQAAVMVKRGMGYDDGK